MKLVYALPPPEDRVIFRMKQWNLVAEQKVNVNNSVDLDVKLIWQKKQFDVDDGYLYPPGFISPFFKYYPDGGIYGARLIERSILAYMKVDEPANGRCLYPPDGLATSGSPIVLLIT